jgi:hypothetical protein
MTIIPTGWRRVRVGERYLFAWDMVLVLEKLRWELIRTSKFAQHTNARGSFNGVRLKDDWIVIRPRGVVKIAPFTYRLFEPSPLKRSNIVKPIRKRELSDRKIGPV